MAASKRMLINLSGLDLLGFSGRTGEWLGESVHKFAKVIHEWNRRYRTRKELLEMEDYMLKDIGISRSDALREGNKPFWEV